MNRQERRKLAKQGQHVPCEPVINLKASDIEKIKLDAVNEAVDKAFLLSLAIPVMIIHDKFGELMKKDGREQRFAEHCLKLYEMYQEGYVTIEDLHQCLYEETGMKII
mgnify:CR=1 FL=1